MPHTSIYSLSERLVVLEELQRRHAGLPDEVRVCGSCAAEYDPKGCYCDREEWLPLAAAIMTLQLAIENLRKAERPDVT